MTSEIVDEKEERLILRVHFAYKALEDLSSQESVLIWTVDHLPDGVSEAQGFESSYVGPRGFFKLYVSFEPVFETASRSQNLAAGQS